MVCKSSLAILVVLLWDEFPQRASDAAEEAVMGGEDGL
jgi:hypothetical protein